MPHRINPTFRVCLSAALCLLLTATMQADSDRDEGDGTIDFVHDIQPIFEEHCNSCHGPDAQEGRLRLDAKAIVLKGGISGPAIVAGNAQNSLLLKRVIGDGENERMPLDADPLSEHQIALIRRWIELGARWPDGVGAQVESVGRHWAYVAPQRRQPATVSNPNWVGNAIDSFILHRLDRERLAPSPESDRIRLLRRLALDLTGLPPSPDDLAKWTRDPSPDGYEKAVDRLLASPRYGERWTIPWLDAARYADSNGYQRDGRRQAWAWRDWVVRALNADMPFDRFTVEQLAGDLLPDATQDQIVATGFHRGTMANVEAGTDPDEEHVLAVIDRVNTTGTVWLGSTIECAQCHNHKYDPFTQRDYYQLYAFFNSTEGEITRNGSGRTFSGPKIPLPLSPAQEVERSSLSGQLDEVKARVKQLTKTLKQQQPQWERMVAESAGDPWQVLVPRSADSKEGASLKHLDDHSLLAQGNFPATDIYEVTADCDLGRVTAFRVDILTDPSLPKGGPGRTEPGNFILSEFRVAVDPSDGRGPARDVKLVDASADFSQTNWNVKNAIDGNRKTGWAVAKQFGRPHHAVFVVDPQDSGIGRARLRFTLDQQYGRVRTIGRFRLLATSGDPSMFGVPDNIRTLVKISPEKRNANQRKAITDYFTSKSPELSKLKTRQTELQTELDAVQPATTLIMKELPEPRETRMFKRGDFLNPGNVVTADTPAALPGLADDAPRNRLGLARWLVDGSNPLVSRVTVNRDWAEFFGHGLVGTVEDFGTQGEPATHPELLDWLATEFVRRDWSMKALRRLMVTSSTYRQSTRVTPELAEVDRYNHLYARGPRQRLKAEFIRDTALQIAGLLSDKLYGPPVFPQQPDGVWNHIGVASNAWTTSSGEDLYRRGMYTYWRRTCYFPSFANFDAPSREACTVQRSVSNTPLQALTLMNDAIYIQSAGALAKRVLSETDPDASTSDRVRHAFRLATGREPQSIELEILEHRFRAERERYSTASKSAETLIRTATGSVPRDEDSHPGLAAWIHVSNVILNLDEVITRG